MGETPQTGIHAALSQLVGSFMILAIFLNHRVELYIYMNINVDAYIYVHRCTYCIHKNILGTPPGYNASYEMGQMGCWAMFLWKSHRAMRVIFHKR